jgi:hypothetical protein
MTVTSDAQLLQARNARLDLVAQTLHVIGKNQISFNQVLDVANGTQQGATVGLADSTGEDIPQVLHKALFDCDTAMMAELALTEIAHSDRKGNTYLHMIE